MNYTTNNDGSIKFDDGRVYILVDKKCVKNPYNVCEQCPFSGRCNSQCHSTYVMCKYVLPFSADAAVLVPADKEEKDLVPADKEEKEVKEEDVVDYKRSYEESMNKLQDVLDKNLASGLISIQDTLCQDLIHVFPELSLTYEDELNYEAILNNLKAENLRSWFESKKGVLINKH